MMTTLKNVKHPETVEVTNLAVQLILKDLDVLFEWANAAAEVSAEAGKLDESSDHHMRARTYRWCHIKLANTLR